MAKELETLKDEIHGKDGLKEKIIKLEMAEESNKKTFEEIRKSLEANATVVSGILKYQTEDQLRNELEKERLKEKRANRVFTIGQTVSIIGLIITVIYYIIKIHA